MKIKSIAAICKKNKQVVLFNRYSDSGTISQYIGDGNAVYPYFRPSGAGRRKHFNDLRCAGETARRLACAVS